jgi:hypothetical protein
VVAKTGEPRTISTGWISLGGLAWANGGKELWFTATRKGGVRALWATTLDGHERELYSSTERLALEDVAPDGRALLSAGRLRAHVLYGSNAGRSPGTLHLTRRTAARGWWTRAREIPARSGDGIEDPLTGAEPTDVAAGFTADGSAIYVFQRDPNGGILFKIDIASGARTPVRTLHPGDPGLSLVNAPFVSLDGQHFVYSVGSLNSQLFMLTLR